MGPNCETVQTMAGPTLLKNNMVQHPLDQSVGKKKSRRENVRSENNFRKFQNDKLKEQEVMSNMRPTGLIQPTEPLQLPTWLPLCTAAHHWHCRLARAPCHWAEARNQGCAIAQSRMQAVDLGACIVKEAEAFGSIALWPGSSTELAAFNCMEPGSCHPQSHSCPCCYRSLAPPPCYCPNTLGYLALDPNYYPAPNPHCHPNAALSNRPGRHLCHLHLAQGSG